MAEAVYAAVYAIGSYLAEAGITAYVAFYVAEISAVLYFAAAVAVSSAYSSAQRRSAERQARDGYNASLQDRLVMVPLAGGQRSRVYGRVRNVEGVLFKATRGADSRFYTLVISLAGHAVEAIDTIYFDDVAVTLDGAGYVATQPWGTTTKVSRQDQVFYGTAGSYSHTLAYTADAGGAITATLRAGSSPQNYVISPRTVTVVGNTVTVDVPYAGDVFFNYTSIVATSKARVRKFLGGAAQDLSPILLPLFPALLTANDRFAGDACLIVDLEYDRDAFPGGVPNITALLRGANDVLDTRTGLRSWTENTALIGRDWAHYEFGGNFPAGTVRDTDVSAAANACDVTTVFTTPAGIKIRPLFTCGIVCRTDQDPSQSFDEIIESMAGRSGWSGGALRMRAGVYRAPVATITEDWLSGVGAMTVVPEEPVEQAGNIVRATIADAAQNYVVAPAPDVRAEAYIELDGRELPLTLTYGGVTDTDHAQHVSGVILREGRSGLTASLPCNLRAFQIELFDLVYVTLPFFGWVNKVFEVADWRFSIGGGVNLTLRETGPSIFDVAALFTASDATPNTQLPNPFLVPVPAGPSLASGTEWLLRQSDGTITSRLHVAWPALTDAAVVNGGAVEVRYGLATEPESAWTSIEVPGGDSQLNIGGVLDGAIYIVKLRARNALVRGQWTRQVSEQIIGKTAAPAVAPTGLAYQLEPFGVRFTCDESPEADVSDYEWRVGPVLATAQVLERRGGTSHLWAVQASGPFTVWVAGVDALGLYSPFASLSGSITLPTVTALSASIVGENVTLRWASSYSAFAISGYEVRYGATFASATVVDFRQTTSYTVAVKWGGSRLYWVAALDVKGNYGTPVSLNVTINPPGLVTATRADVVDNNALLYWSPPAIGAGQLSIDRYEVRKGASFAAGAVVGSNGNSTFAGVFEQASGTFTYWVVAVDSAGNIGPAASIVATINQPPDYVLRSNYDSALGGTTTNFYLAAGVLTGPVNTTQTWATHFTSNGWATPADQVAAGFPIYAEPSLTAGAYEEVIDYGAAVPATVVTATINTVLIDGTVSAACTLSWKLLAGDPWTVLATGVSSALIPQFRYLRVHYDFACTAGANLIQVVALNVKLATKLRNDSGAGTSALGGMAVLFGYPFISADTPIIQANGLDAFSKPYTCAAIYAGVANPTGFTARIYNSAGTEVAGVNFSWTVRGY